MLAGAYYCSSVSWGCYQETSTHHSLECFLADALVVLVRVLCLLCVLCLSVDQPTVILTRTSLGGSWLVPRFWLCAVALGHRLSPRQRVAGRPNRAVAPWPQNPKTPFSALNKLILKQYGKEASLAPLKTIQLEHAVLLCVEPHSKQVFSVNLGTQEIERLSDTVQSNLQNKI